MISCTYENGHQTFLRHGVVDAIVEKERKILLIKRAKHMYQGSLYAVPGGFINRDENIKEAVLRELYEETGYKGTIDSLFSIIDTPERNDDRQNIGFVFLITVGKQTGKPDNETNKVLWCDIDNLPKEKEFAFDHYRILQSYKSYRKKKTPLPILP